MKKKGINIGRQIQFWAMLGPFVLLLSFSLGFFKTSGYCYCLALIPVVSLPLCLRWRTAGLYVALSLTVATVILGYGQLPAEERFWLVGMAMAIALGMVVTVLSLEEARLLIQHLQVESRSRLDNLLRIDERLRSAQVLWQQEKEDFQSGLSVLRRQLQEKDSVLTTYERLVPVMRDEMAGMEETRSQLIIELEANRQDRAQVDRSLQDAKLEIKGLTDAYSMTQGEREKACHKKIASLEESLVQSDQQYVELYSKLDHAEANGREAEANASRLETYLTELREERQRLKSDLEKAAKQATALQTATQEASGKTSDLEEQCGVLRESISRADTELATVRQKLMETDEARRALEGEKQALAGKNEGLEEKLLDLAEKYQSLKEKNGALSGKSAALEKESEALKAEMEAQAAMPVPEPHSEELDRLKDENSVLTRSVNRWEAMYRQLRAQFEEKGKILGDTRAQLFHVENEYLSLQREHVEEKDLNVGDVEASLERYLRGMEQDLSSVEQEQAWGEEAYSELVAALLTELAASKTQKQHSRV